MTVKIDEENICQRLAPEFGDEKAALLTEVIKEAVAQAVSPKAEKPVKRLKTVEELRINLKRYNIYILFCGCAITYGIGLIVFYSFFNREPFLGFDVFIMVTVIIQVIVGSLLMLDQIGRRQRVVKALGKLAC